LPKMNHVEFCRLLEKLDKCINKVCTIEIYRTTRVTIKRPSRVNLSTPSTYRDGSALGARFVLS